MAHSIESFLYRRLIRRLSTTHRAVAPEQIGFGFPKRSGDHERAPRRRKSILFLLGTQDVTVECESLFGVPLRKPQP